MPFFVLLLVFSTFFLQIFLTSSLYPSKKIHDFSFIELTITLILFLWSYFSAACSDPGYLPYDWIRTKKFYYSWEELIPGIAIREDQFLFAQFHRPPGASFSKYSGRFILRADHLCGWITNWVGKRNHKHFLLLLFWGMIYCGSLIGWQFTFIHWPQGPKLLFLIFSDSFVCTFLISFVLIFAEAIVNLIHNQTSIDTWNHRKNPHNSTKDACKEICGDQSILCWLIPIPPFGKNLTIGNDQPPGFDVL